MSKSSILNKLKRMKWINYHWRVKDFVIKECKDYIIFLLNINGDLYQKIFVDKNNGYTQVYDLSEEQHLIVDLYL